MNQPYCPRCGHAGRSVAAMTKKETRLWEKEGEFSFSGIGVSSGAIGVGAGSGSYRENGVTGTKRAIEFRAPQRSEMSIDGILFAMIGGLVSYLMLPKMLPVFVAAMAPETDQATLAQLDTLITILKYLGPVAAVLAVISSFKRIREVEKEEKHLNEVVYPAQLARYNELYYCEGCNSLFDRYERVKDANEFGFSAMMELPASH